MSLFLGKIHYWLYDKINWFEALEVELIKFANEKGLPGDEWAKELYETYGYPAGNKPLEEVIDTNNIHGWLQDKIHRAEGRHAALITRLLEKNAENLEGLKDVFQKQGALAASRYDGQTDDPEALFNALNDFLLEGMPCDRVNEVTVSEDNEIKWVRTVCLHNDHWNNAGGDVKNFYILRDEWTKAFVENLSSNMTYNRLSEETQAIQRKGE
ncbi:hypothetical protein [Alkalibacter mobilis]|uniref:hypothetical protein n=1 Tax=Alkalibacter mobilis TaxID=2787712 RepID=UPI0018A09863|nr:hypothetical protein [Alkalibacter mobilis]MBF7096173.1 hypothetical protein [Alkalibacter mobilis]